MDIGVLVAVLGAFANDDPSVFVGGRFEGAGGDRTLLVPGGVGADLRMHGQITGSPLEEAAETFAFGRLCAPSPSTSGLGSTRRSASCGSFSGSVRGRSTRCRWRYRRRDYRGRARRGCQLGHGRSSAGERAYNYRCPELSTPTSVALAMTRTLHCLLRGPGWAVAS